MKCIIDTENKTIELLESVEISVLFNWIDDTLGGVDGWKIKVTICPQQTQPITSFYPVNDLVNPQQLDHLTGGITYTDYNLPKNDK